MDFKELKYIIAVAEYKNISKAAESLGVTQPSLSKFIRNLEMQYGVEFFQYINKTYQTTYAGEFYLQTARKILQLAEILEREALQIDTDNEHKVLRVFCPIFKSFHILPTIVPQLKLKYPNITLIFKEDIGNSAEKLLLSGEVDIAVTNFTPKDKNIYYETLADEEIQLIVSRQNPLVNEGVWKRETGKLWIDIKKFRYESIILPAPEQMTRHIVDDLLRQENIKPNILMVTRSFQTAIRVAASGAGVAFAPEFYVYATKYLQTPVGFSVGNVRLELKSMIAYRKQYVLPPEARYFIKCVKRIIT